MTAAAYSITHRETGREYIGQTANDARLRWSAHISSAGRVRSAIGAALAKYGSRAFDFQIEAMLPTADEAKIAEMILIATRKPVFNLTRGGDGCCGCKHPPRTAETRAKLAAARTGLAIWGGTRSMHEAQVASANARRGKPNPAHAAKITGRKASAETKAKMSESQKKRCADPALKARVSAQMSGSKSGVGRKDSAETIAKRVATTRARREAKRKLTP